MTSRIFLFGLLVASGLALAASFDMTKSVLPLLQPGSARQQRDVILSDADEDFDFFQSLKPRFGQTEGQGKSNIGSLEKYGFRQVDANPDADRIRRLLMKLQVRSDQFLDIAQRTGFSAVDLLIAFTKLVENSKDNFIIVAQ